MVKVYPSLKTQTSGMLRNLRNIVKDTSLFGFALAIYSRECEMLYEGDEVSIFGKVVYNVKNDEFAFDRCFSMFQGGKESALSFLNSDWWWNVFSAGWKGCLMALGTFATFFTCKMLSIRLK